MLIMTMILNVLNIIYKQKIEFIAFDIMLIKNYFLDFTLTTSSV